jgi:uncharacterized membrane protein
LGSYFFAEAILNFGTYGAVLASIAVIIILAWLERTRNDSDLRQIIYPIVAMLMPMFALYGSSNLFKEGLAVVVIATAIYLVGRSNTMVTVLSNAVVRRR